MRVDRATPGDTPAAEALLSAAGLPIEGAAEALSALGVVGRVGNRIVATAAVERYDDSGLLRSVAVDVRDRGSGLGREIVGAAEALARREGIHELYLLTETAVDWFPRLGYEPVDRGAAEASVGASVEFTTVCRDTGTAMRKYLG